MQVSDVLVLTVRCKLINSVFQIFPHQGEKVWLMTGSCAGWALVNTAVNLEFP
jgi:hypothetical protein